jgi:hypothetical protein
MDEIAYQLQHSVEVESSLDFVWAWQTDVKNWVDRPPNSSSTVRLPRGPQVRPCSPGNHYFDGGSDAKAEASTRSAG